MIKCHFHLLDHFDVQVTLVWVAVLSNSRAEMSLHRQGNELQFIDVKINTNGAPFYNAITSGS